MPLVRLSREARAVIRANSTQDFRDNARNVSPDGSADVPLSADVIERLDSYRLSDESYSHLIIRLFATLHKPLQ